VAASRFVDAFRPTLAPAMREVLGRPNVHDTPACVGWAPPFSMLEHRVARSARGGASVYAAEAALALHAAGTAGEWPFAFEMPARLRFDRFILPPVMRGSVAASDGQVVITAGDRDFAFVRLGDGWTPRDGHLETLPRIDDVTFVNAAALDHRDDGVIPCPLIDVDNEVLASWKTAFDLIRRVSPQYRLWVARLIRFIIPLDAQPGAMVNGSQGHRWGEVHMSSKLDPLMHAEMLVHEASHQHYFLVQSLGPVSDGTDPTMYYSPLVREQRPVERILLAYHAVANILLFYDDYEAAGGEITPFFTRNRAQLRAELEELAPPLRTNRGLTGIGHAMWQPLDAALSKEWA
jgi:HEXXH motif-containing protein